MTALSDALATLPEAVFADVLESPEAYLLVFDVPGVTEDALDVTVTGNTLSIAARREKAVPDQFWFREEARPLFLDVDVPLPPDAHGSAATAHLDSGVLEITVPKASGTTTDVPIEG
jgi:HSP20 family molecular chaperone IbpA